MPAGQVKQFRGLAGHRQGQCEPVEHVVAQTVVADSAPEPKNAFGGHFQVEDKTQFGRQVDRLDPQEMPAG